MTDIEQMPPNKKGGKGYRKGKHSGEQEAEMLQWDEQGGQMPGRVLKKLGDRRFRVFCNDNKERICKLCGSMRKSEWVEEGSLVILGTRELGNATNATTDPSKGILIGDILAVVDPSLYGKFKKMDTVNKILFTSVESQDIHSIMKKIEKAKKEDDDTDDDMFDRSGENETKEDSEEEDSEGEPLTEQEKVAKRREKEKKRDAEFAARRDAKGGDYEDVNIDEI